MRTQLQMERSVDLRPPEEFQTATRSSPEMSISISSQSPNNMTRTQIQREKKQNK